jgi:AraC-like DNA-binding protein
MPAAQTHASTAVVSTALARSTTRLPLTERHFWPLAWIRQRRLGRCRDSLADPVNADVPVGAVAARWGLTDAAHLSRIFRRAYGLSPAEYRRMCLSDMLRSGDDHAQDSGRDTRADCG